MSTIVSWLKQADPSAVAVADDAETLTYGALLDEAARLATALSGMHGRGRYLLIPAQRSVGFIRALVAASLSGNVPVPVDPQAPVRVIEELGARCGSWALVDLETAFEGCDRLAGEREKGLAELVIFTSGTSGVPKGVPISSTNLTHSASAVAAYLEYRRHPSAAVVLPLHYSYALLTQVLFMFHVGGRARIFSSFRNPIAFARAVEREALQTFCGVPSTYSALCAVHRMSKLSMPSIRIACSAGAAMDRSLMNQIAEMFPNAAFFDNYGMTEATPRISYVRSDDPKFSEATCGTAIDGLEVRVLDDEHRPLRDGERGIIAVRGPSVFAGYLNDPESTREAFTADGFVLSGDLGYVRDGYIYIEGRKDEVFNVGGEKVAPLEIERALAEHPDVLACAVTRLHDAGRGDVPVAYVELARPVDRRILVAFLNDMLPPAKVPVRYFEVRAFPLTANGKLQRKRLTPDDAELVVREIT